MDDILPPQTETDRERQPLTADAILRDNEERIRRITLTDTNQLTGRGLPHHTVPVSIPDFSEETLYITPELAGNRLWSLVTALGSVRAYCEHHNATHPDKPLREDTVKRGLLLTRLHNDPAFAFYVCFKIQDKNSGRTVPFTLNYAQIILLEELEQMRREKKPIRIILLKARQWGGSTLTQLYMAWIQLFRKEGWNSVIIAQTKDTAKRIKAMYTRVLKHFPAQIVYSVPDIMFSPKEKSTADYTITDKGSNVVRDNVITVASYENFESTRGANFAMMHGSEVAYWTETQGKTAEALITNIAGGMLNIHMTLEVLESTANGMAGYFYDEYQLAKAKRSNRKAIFIPFFYLLNCTEMFPNAAARRLFATELLANRFKTADDSTSESGEYLFSLWRKGASLEAIAWYIQKRKSFHDHASMASEFPSDDVECFKHSGHTIFNQYLVDKYRKEYAREPIYRGEVVSPDGKFPRLGQRDERGELWIWQYADAAPMNDRYVVVVDVGGRSAKADFSVITIVDRLPLVYEGKMEVVARWRGHIRYDFLAVKAVLLARMYCNALLVFESNTFDKKKAESTEFVYEGDHTRGILAKIEDEYPNLYMRQSTSPEDIRQGRFKKVGFQTNVKTKQDMVDLMTVSFEDDTRFLDPDYRLYEEMAIYEQKEDGSYGNIAGKDNHDDILMTDMIANLVSDKIPLPSAPSVNISEAWEKGAVNESLL